MTDHDDILKELKAELQAEPSREFAAGVRERVTRSEVRVRRAWWGLAAAAAVALTTVALWRPAADEPVAGPGTPMLASAPAVPRVQPEAVIARGTPAPVVPRRASRTARAASPSSDPRLVVITNQAAVLRQLWADYGTRALQETTVQVEPPAPPTEVKPPAPVAVEPIVVPPIVVSELGVPVGRGGATPVIRRMEATKETR